MTYKRSKADLCLYYKWTETGLSLWISWIDDCLTVGKEKIALQAKKQMTQLFNCDDTGEMQEYVGCKIKRNIEEGWLKIMQPVLLQSLNDEFDLPKGADPKTPAVPGSILHKTETKSVLTSNQQHEYQKGTGKLLHLMHKSRLEILNSVQELSRFMQE